MTAILNYYSQLDYATIFIYACMIKTYMHKTGEISCRNLLRREPALIPENGNSVVEPFFLIIYDAKILNDVIYGI